MDELTLKLRALKVCSIFHFHGDLADTMATYTPMRYMVVSQNTYDSAEYWVDGFAADAANVVEVLQGIDTPDWRFAYLFDLEAKGDFTEPVKGVQRGWKFKGRTAYESAVDPRLPADVGAYDVDWLREVWDLWEDEVYCRDLLKQHLADQQPLTADEVDKIVEWGVAEESDFEERLPEKFWHKSHEPFPEGWTEQDQKEAEGGS